MSRSMHLALIEQYVADFRRVHSDSFKARRPFCADDLGDLGQFVLGELIYAEFKTGPWLPLMADEHRAAEVSVYLRENLRPRLEAYKRRKTAEAPKLVWWNPMSWLARLRAKHASAVAL